MWTDLSHNSVTWVRAEVQVGRGLCCQPAFTSLYFLEQRGAARFSSHIHAKEILEPASLALEPPHSGEVKITNAGTAPE